jgi:hypothetical protein
VHCPFHQDGTPSLSINTKAGLYNCFACCATGNGFDLYMKIKAVDFKTALGEFEALAGINPGNQSMLKTFLQVVPIFIYHDAASNFRYWKKRFEPGFEAGRKKSFAIFHEVDGKEKKGRDSEPLLYNLQMLAKAPKEEPVFSRGRGESANPHRNAF